MKTFLIYIGLSLALFACSSNENTATEKNIVAFDGNISHTDQEKMHLTFTELEMREMSTVITANGTVEVPPQNRTFVSLPYGGYITKINILDGSKVTKGQELIQIQHPEIIQLQEDYLQTKAQLVFLESEYERLRLLVSKEAASVRNMQQIKSEFEAAKAKKSGLLVKLNLAEVNISRIERGEIQRYQSIVAPFNGVVTKLLAQNGAFVDSKQPILEIIDLKHAHVELTVFEKYAGLLKEGEKVTLSSVSGAEPIEASIFLVGKEISPQKTIKVHCHLKDTKEFLTPGTFFKAEIQSNGRKLLTVPTSAITSYKGKNVVFERSNPTLFVPLNVEIVAQDDQFTAIRFTESRPIGKIVAKGAYELMTYFTQKNTADE